MNEYYSDQGEGGSGAIFKTLACCQSIQVSFRPNKENSDLLGFSSVIDRLCVVS